MAIIGTNVTKACRELVAGNLVGIPTETVYGLAGNAFDPSVVAKIFEVKKRPSFDPLIVHIPSQSYLEHIVSGIPEQADMLARHFWPGPLTLVMSKQKLVPDLLTSGLPTVAVRVPNHDLTLELLERLDFPLASPSANPFGYVSPTTPQHVISQLGNDIPYILDGGACTVGIESTIVGFEPNGPVIYRPGGISKEEIEQVIGKVSDKTNTAATLAPGMLKSHYSPSKTLLLGSIPDLVKRYGSEEIGVLSFQNCFDNIKGRLSDAFIP